MISWHYTIAARAMDILEDGMIKPATAGVIPPERPAVWFSVHPHWEATANKRALLAGGEIIHLSTTDMFNGLAGELWRFGLDTRHLLPWKRLIKKARISKSEQHNLICAADLMGGKPSHWYGSIQPIDVEETRAEIFNNKSRKWERLQCQELHM